MNKLNSISTLIELGNYLKYSFAFVLIESGLQEEYDINWNIQYMDLGVLGDDMANRDLRIILEIVIVQKSAKFDNEEAELIISKLKEKFNITVEPLYATIERNGKFVMITKMQDVSKKRYELICTKNISPKFQDFKVTISIESVLRKMLPDAKLILTDEDVQRHAEKIIDEFREENNYLNSFIEKLSTDTNPLIITEGKTDLQHIRKAKEKLNLDTINIEFCEITENWGDSKLKTLLEQSAILNHSRVIIGIFDRDDETIVQEIENNESILKDYGNNVFGICIPLQNESIYGNKISIEHYYPENILMKSDPNSRRLFLGNEFYHSGNSRDGNYQTRISKIQHKVDVNGVIDEKVFEKNDLEQKNSIALTKANFANLVETDVEFIGDFDFISFVELFKRIEIVLNYSKNKA
jgi:hypothetical protein